jgi:hypothetical protein
LERRRRRYSEALDEQANIVHVALAPLVAEPEPKLKLWTETANGPPSDRTCCSQVLRGIATPGHLAGRQLLPAVARGIEGERVEIDLPSAFVSHDEASREAWLTTAVVVEPAFVQGPPRRLEVLGVEGEVEVGVLTRFLTDERVDAPAAVHPCLDTDGLEPVQYLYDVTGSQTAIRRPKRAGQILLNIVHAVTADEPDRLRRGPVLLGHTIAPASLIGLRAWCF